MMDNLNGTHNTDRRIFSVSELTASIKSLLEDQFPFIWISGEISNFRIPSSGHFYFTLKDERSQVSAVMFRGHNRNLRFDLEDGLAVVGLGRISVYEPRGTYQVIFEYIEPKGVGALQLAFEKLKNRLSEEGLFDARFKNEIPYLPQHISLITSPTGAVVHDIIHILFRRYPNIILEILPVKVQGNDAADQITEALYFLNERGASDIIILARGGGSLEDFQAFNSESVARGVFSSRIPVISAVGHEIDYTISDFTADLRAPTPSAAAELVVPVKSDLVKRTADETSSLIHAMNDFLDGRRRVLKDLQRRLIDPKKQVDDWRLKLDDLTSRFTGAAIRNLRRQREKLDWRRASLVSGNPLPHVHKVKDRLYQIDSNLFNLITNMIEMNERRVSEIKARLNALNPTAILQRGYSITRTIPGEAVIRDADGVAVHQHLEVLLAKGRLTCRVERKMVNGKENV
jgi:exodeoxyribonuclease VII large subunit